VKGLLHNFLVNIDFDHNAVRILENFISVFIQDLLYRTMVRTFGNRCHHISVLVKDSQPGSHAVFYLTHISSIYFMTLQFADHIIPHSVVIYQTDKGWFQLYIGNIFHYISSYTAVDLLDHTGISSSWNKWCCGITFHIDKNITDYNNSHIITFLLCYVISFGLRCLL